MSTLTGLIGGGGGDMSPPTSLVDGNHFTWNAVKSSARAVSIGSASLSDVVNITSGSGYLYGIWGTSGSTNNYRCQVIIDGTTVYDITSSTTVTNTPFPVWPFPVREGSVVAATFGGAMLRFETSLRVRHAGASGVTCSTNVNYYLT